MAWGDQSADQIKAKYEQLKTDSDALESDIPGMSNDDLKVIAKLLAANNRWLRALTRITIQHYLGI